jgi:hypothetical protein
MSPKTGDTLTATYSGGNGSGAATWEWLVNNIVIPGAHGNTYTVATSDQGKAIKARISYANQRGSVASSSTISVAAAVMVNTFNSINAFKTWLSSQPANTAATPYRAKLNINNLGGSAFSSTSLGNVLYTNNTKYISLDLSDSTITEIPPDAFSVFDSSTSASTGCVTLTSITIPNSVYSIGDTAFANCTNLTSVIIPDSVVSIGEYAFISCFSLTSVTIPNSVASIGRGAFADCTSLIYVNVAINNSAYTAQDGVLYNKNKTTLITYPAGRKGSFTIPNSVTNIEEYAFVSCYSLTSITIPNSVSSIGLDAFAGCTSLTSVTIPDSVTSIGNGAFSACSNLTSVIISNSVTRVHTPLLSIAL